MHRGLCAILLLNAAPLLASPVQTAKPALAPVEHLRAWLAANPVVQAKLSRDKTPSFVEPDLKDSIADRPVAEESSHRQPECPDLPGCAVPPLAMDVPAGEPVEPAILAMMRPWIWLADAKGVRLGVAHAAPESPAVLAMNVQGLGLSGVGLNISPRPEGGVHLWFSRGFELAAAYSRERAEIYGPAPPRIP
jgi:hypothetical protein